MLTSFLHSSPFELRDRGSPNLMRPSGNLSGGQCFLALDTGKMIVRNSWKELPMLLAVINRVNVLGHAKRSLLVFTDHHGQVIGNYTPTAGKTDDTDASVLSAVNDLYSPVPPVPSETPGVFLGEKAAMMSSQEWRLMMLHNANCWGYIIS
jgi:hypothetical protein